MNFNEKGLIKKKNNSHPSSHNAVLDQDFNHRFFRFTRYGHLTYANHLLRRLEFRRHHIDSYELWNPRLDKLKLQTRDGEDVRLVVIESQGLSEKRMMITTVNPLFLSSLVITPHSDLVHFRVASTYRDKEGIH